MEVKKLCLIFVLIGLYLNSLRNIARLCPLQKNHTFQIMIANGSEDKMDNSICRATLEAMVEEHKKYIYQRNEEFYRIISEIISRLETTLRTFGQMKKIVAENKQYIENRI